MHLGVAKMHAFVHFISPLNIKQLIHVFTAHHRVLMHLASLESTQKVRVVLGLLYLSAPCAQAVVTTGSIGHNLMCLYYFADC